MPKKRGEATILKQKHYKNNLRQEFLKAMLFCHQKYNKKADRLCMKFSSTQIEVGREV